MKHFLDPLIGWDGASPRLRSMLLQAFCDGIQLRSLASNGLTLVILGGLLVAETGETLHLAWLLTVLAGGLLPRGYAHHLRRQGHFDQEPERKALIFIILSGIYGLLWGLGPLLLLPQLTGASVGILLVLVVFGTVMGPYASMPGILYVRLLTTGLPTLIAVALHGSPRLAFVCAVVAVWLTLRTDVWRSYQRLLRRQLELQLALETRQAELEQANRSTEEANLRLKEMADTDPLTGVPNRRHFMRRLAELRGPAALVLLDVDHFKSINDRFGHEAGDRMLIELAEQARSVLREGDLLARLGGEEFGVLLTPAEPGDAWAIAERIRARIEANQVAHGEALIRVTVSLGIANVPAGAMADATVLLREADAALYTAKRLGRNRTAQPTTEPMD